MYASSLPSPIPHLPSLLRSPQNRPIQIANPLPIIQHREYAARDMPFSGHSIHATCERQLTLCMTGTLRHVTMVAGVVLSERSRFTLAGGPDVGQHVCNVVQGTSAARAATVVESDKRHDTAKSENAPKDSSGHLGHRRLDRGGGGGEGDPN